MEGTPTSLGVRAEPWHLSFERAWKWCVLTTLHDLRLSVRRRRTVSLPNTRRLFLRRFNDLCRHRHLPESSSACQRQERLGVLFIQQQYAAEAGRSV